MRVTFWAALLYAFGVCQVSGADEVRWWNPQWRMRTTVARPAPYRDARPRPVEAAVDFPLLLKRAGIPGEFDPASVRVVVPDGSGPGREVPAVCRTEFDARRGRTRTYVAWIAHPEKGGIGRAHIYFDTKDRRIPPPKYAAKQLPPENLVANSGFEQEAKGLPAAWNVTEARLVSLGRFEHTTGRRSLKVVVDEKTPQDVSRTVTVSQKIDVREFAGCEMVFECDLLAERAIYGAPVLIELRQFRADGSAIPEYAVQPRWLSIELAPGQLVQFCERGRFNPEAAEVEVNIRFRCYVLDADTRKSISGPEAFFTVWLDRVVVRPGERWPWPAATNAGFVEGAIPDAPLNRGFEFTGRRRLAFNGASEGTLTAGKYNPNPRSVHWGVKAGTLEFWCKPSWNADDGLAHILFESVAYMHRRQCRVRKLDASGKNMLEFSIGDSDAKLHTICGPAPLKAGRWHHIAGTWDFAKAHVQLFVDGVRVAQVGPSDKPWPFSLTAKGDKKLKGLGVTEDDKRSVPMQAFIGGDRGNNEGRGAGAVIDEFRISDVVRYPSRFTLPRKEFEVDEHTRALWHFENERHGVHDSDDRFVRGMLACELPPQEEAVPLDLLEDGRIVSRKVVVRPYPSPELFEKNRAEARLPARVVLRPLPDPRFVECHERRTTRTVTRKDDTFTLKVGGDYEPLMGWVTFEHADPSSSKTTLLPRWRANDSVLPFSVKSIAETLCPDCKTDRERAFETFKYSLLTTNYYDAHYAETLPCGRHRPRVSYTLIKALNIYPFDQCGPMNHMLRKLFLCTGISSANASGTHHQFEQAFYSGDWRLFDLSARLYWLDRDNQTVLSRRGLEYDPYLKLRQGGNINAWIPGRKGRAGLGHAVRPHNMDFSLRPGERVSVCWHNEGRWFEVTGEKREPIPLAKIPPFFGNGALVYEPVPRGEAAALDNVVIEGGVVRAKDSAKPAQLIYRARCPYILSDLHVTGAYAAPKAGDVRLQLSFDEGKNWTAVWENAGKSGEIAANPIRRIMGRYAYWLKVAMAPGGGAEVRNLKVRTTFVVSPLSLPGRLRKGENRITFFGGPTEAPVKTTCCWIERSKTDLGFSVKGITYYANEGEFHRNLVIFPPGGELPVEVELTGRKVSGTVSLDRLPRGWTFEPREVSIRQDGPAKAIFTVRPEGAKEGSVHAFDVVVREGPRERRVTVQVLVAQAALVRDAERADEITQAASPRDVPEAGGGRAVCFSGKGTLRFDFAGEGKYALWLHARWEEASSKWLTLSLDGGKERYLRPMAMIGFKDWTDPTRAHTKMFAHFSRQFGEWSWYRIPDIVLKEGKHRLTLGTGNGVWFDAVVLLPQNPAMDRAAMNLFQNWNYAPWRNPQ